MDQELVHISGQPQEVVEYEDPGSGLEDVRLRPTYLTLIQPSTNDFHGARPGQIYDELTQEIFDELVVVPLRQINNRVMYPPGAPFTKGVKPLCRSSDGLFPSQYVENPQSVACVKKVGGKWVPVCKYAQWVDGKRPVCGEKIKLLVIVKDTGLPRYVTIGGKSIAPWRTNLERIKQTQVAMQMRKNNPIKLNLYDFFFTLTTEKEGATYKYAFKDVLYMNDIGAFGPLYDEYVKRAKYQDDEEAVESTQVDNAVTQVMDAQVVEI